MTEFLKRFLQWLFGLGLFDFPPFNLLRNFVYSMLFSTGRKLSVGRACRFIRADFTLDPRAAGSLKIGHRVAINYNVEIDYSGGVAIEDDVWISQNVLIESHTHVVSGRPKAEWGLSRSPLLIARDAWIGANAVIMDSVKVIGEGAVVGAGAVVVHDVPPRSVVGGVPARFIKMRE